MIDVSVFVPAMPDSVREAFAEASAGNGVAAAWLAKLAGDSSWRVVLEVFALANKPEVPADLLGWIAGITMFVDESRRLGSVLKRRSYRDSAIPHALVAIATGIERGVPAGGWLWIGIEALVQRAAAPPELVAVLAHGLVSKHALARGAALRMAQRIGEPARAAIAARGGIALDDALATLAGAPLVETSADDSELLARLLAAWRATHDPQLEMAIVRLGTQIGRARGDIVAKSKGELEAAWLAVADARDPADVSRLLEAAWPSQWKPAVARVEALAKHEPDPRIALGLAEHARAYDSKGSGPLHAAVARVLERMPAMTLRPLLDAIEGARTAGGTAAIYAKTRAAIATLVPASADADLLAEAAARDDGFDVAPLYAQVYANPGDLGARAVLADALQLAGDPRGEFIALQLAIAAGTAHHTAWSRTAALLAQHGDAWTGPLPGVVAASRQFERGFLAYTSTDAGPELLARSIDRPEWTTVERFAASAPQVDLAPLLAKMRRLTFVRAHPLALRRLAAEHGGHPGITTLHCYEEGYLPPPGAFPDLAVVIGSWFQGGFRGDGPWDLAAFRAVEREAAALNVRAIVYTRFPVPRLATALGECELGPPETRFVFHGGDPQLASEGWRVRVRRGDPVVDVACGDYTDYRYNAEGIYAALLAAGRTRIRLHLKMTVHDEERRLPAGLAVEDGAWFDLTTS